jgi:hypothetical protein
MDASNLMTKSYSFVLAMHGELNPRFGSGPNLIFLPPKETTEESTSVKDRAVLRIRIDQALIRICIGNCVIVSQQGSGFLRGTNLVKFYFLLHLFCSVSFYKSF